MSKLDQVLAAVDKFESDLGFTAPELIPMRVDQLRGMVRDVFEDGDPDPLTVTPIGYQGAAQHTFTANCDGFHEPGQCPTSERPTRHVVDFGPPPFAPVTDDEASL